MYPKVFEEYHQFHQEFGDVSFIPTTAFFYGLRVGEEITVRLDEGKTLLVRLVSVLDVDENGMRAVIFELNGQTRPMKVKDRRVTVKKLSNQKIEADNPAQIGAPLQGKLAKVMVKKGDVVKENTPLFVIEAMKMETTVTASKAGKVKRIVLDSGMVEQDDWVIEVE
jgi:pyruvate carboxylase